MIKVSKEKFKEFLDSHQDVKYERIRWSTPFRYNFFCNNKMIAYSYDSYMDDEEEYWIKN